MGCNSVGGMPFILRSHYNALTVGAVLTSPICSVCGNDNRCLMIAASSQLSVVNCECHCIDYNASTVQCTFAQTHEMTKSASTSHSMALTGTGTTTTSASGSQTVSTSTTASKSRGSRSLSVSLSLTQTNSTSASLSESLAPSVSASSSVSASQSTSSYATLSSTVSTSSSATKTATESETENVTESESQTFGSRSPAQSMSPSITTSLTVTRSHSGGTGSRSVRGLSTSQSPSLTTSLPVSLSDCTRSNSFTLSETPSAIHSASATVSASLSPLWPAALGITVASGSPATVLRYLANGVVWFNTSTTAASFTLWPRQLDGRDMPAGFYRHPQPPFTIRVVNSSAPLPFVASVSAQCSLSLPCAIYVVPSSDRFTPVELSVNYGTPAVPTLSTTAVFAYASQDPDHLQIVTDTPLTVCGGAPLPEVYVRVVDADGSLHTASTHAYLTIAGGWSNFTEAYIVAGQVATTLFVLPAALNGTGVLRLTAAATGLRAANITFTIVQCPPVLQGTAGFRRQLYRVFASANASLPATALFYAPVSSIPRTLYCRLASSASGSPSAAAVQPVRRINASTVQCDIFDNTTEVALVIGLGLGNTTAQVVPLAWPVSPPMLVFVNTFTFASGAAVFAGNTWRCAARLRQRCVVRQQRPPGYPEPC
ncbi:Hypothetical protein, putative [Bodo saltans]|uniref:Uncharacterized protein n=1 Tax=Bodo saltans TaxID=75058 RepID=A0A0S4J0R5_BODSA|nr:Hypothetical protein, putative [Bodo saltans]|eukprot:CUG06530.1 Hypothetical protein, putative [Bodo saltans]